MIPVACKLFLRDHPEVNYKPGPFNLGRKLGAFCNVVAISWTCFAVTILVSSTCFGQTQEARTNQPRHAILDHANHPTCDRRKHELRQHHHCRCHVARGTLVPHKRT